VSLASEIVQLVGTSSVPVIVGGSVLGVFELGERFASQRAKDALANWLLSFDVRKATALPEGTQELFERIFGERHFSLKCFVRSAAFSLGAMAFVSLLLLLISPKYFLSLHIMSKRGDWLLVALWVPWSIFVDYISLLKTRVILRIITRMRPRNRVVAIAILVLDYLLYCVIFDIGVKVIWWAWTEDDAKLLGSWMWPPRFFFFPSQVRFFIFFWSGFAPSIWMWLYVFALVVTLTLLRSEKLITWLRWALDVEKNPFRSIGAVAATLAFVMSVAIILVSAEVSRISTAL